MVAYWARHEAPEGCFGQDESRWRLNGLVHSILCGIDGVSCSFGCGLDLIPGCDPSDPEFCREQGDDWYPVNAEVREAAEGTLNCGGDYLHNLWKPRT